MNKVVKLDFLFYIYTRYLFFEENIHNVDFLMNNSKLFGKLWKLLQNFFFFKYRNDSLERQQIILPLINIFIVYFILIIPIICINLDKPFILWGQILSLIFIYIALILIRIGKAESAPHVFLILFINLGVSGIIDTYYAIPPVSFETIYRTSMYFIFISIIYIIYNFDSKNDGIIWGITNSLMIIRYIIMIHKNSVQFISNIYDLIFALVIMNIGIFSGFLIHNLHLFFFKMIQGKHDAEIGFLTQVIGEYIPICANCKSIRIKDGKWQRIESFVEENSLNVKFTHGLCDICIKKLYPEEKK